MTRSRDQLASIFSALLEGVLVVPDLREVNELDPVFPKGLVQIIRATVKPGNRQSSYELTHELWVCIPSVELETLEDDLEDLVDEVLEALQTQNWLAFVVAERDVHPVNAMPAYRIEITTYGNTTTD